MKLPRWLAISVVFVGIGVTLTIALWYLVPLIWKQLVYARDSIPAGIHWINATFYLGCLQHLMSSKWKLTQSSCLKLSWNMSKQTIAQTAFRQCY